MDCDHEDDEMLASMYRRVTELERSRSEIDALLLRARLEYTDARNRKAAIYTLPIEILALIFEECVLDFPLRESKRIKSALTMSQISRHFRNVALSTPSLWSQIEHMVGRRGDLFRTAACLERSKTLPLTICLLFNDKNCPPGLEDTFNTIIPHVRRWQELHLRGFLGTDNGLIACIGRLNNTEAPNMQRLYVERQCFAEEEDITLSECRMFRSGAPRLAFVQYIGIAPSYGLANLTSVRQLHIKKLIDHRIVFPRLFFALNGLSHLTHLNIDDTLQAGDDAGFRWPSNFHLPALTTLAINVAAHTGLLSHFLPMLKAPLLQFLILEDVGSRELHLLFDELDFLDVSPEFPELRSLTMGGSSMKLSQALWDQLTVFLPHITNFTLIYLGLGAVDANPSGLIESALVFWPHLHTFTVNYSPGTSIISLFIPPTIASMLLKLTRRRSKMGFPIRNLKLSRSIMDLPDYDMIAPELGTVVERVITDQWSGMTKSRLVDQLWLDPVRSCVCPVRLQLIVNYSFQSYA